MLQKSNTFVNLLNAESSIVQHVELSLYKSTSDNRTLKKTVFIFAGYEYEVTYYDTENNKVNKISGVITDFDVEASSIYSQSITMMYWPKEEKDSKCNPCIPPEEKPSEIVQGMPSCDCVLNKPDLSKYQGPETIEIPMNNLLDLNYLGSGKKPDLPKPMKKVVKVVLLGISAEICRAVVVNLKMLEDNQDNAVKEVNLKTGNVYTIAYLSQKDKCVYEFDGKLVSISETNDAPKQDTVVRTSEQVGLNDTIYNSCDICNDITDRDMYMACDCMKNDVRLTFDISVDFTGEYDSIMLSQIRDCTLIEEEGEPVTPVEPVEPSKPDPKPDDNKSCCDACPGKVIDLTTSNNAKIEIDPKTKEVKYTSNSGTQNISLKEIMEFYFAE